MSKTTLIDCCIKKYAYREISEIYKEIGASPQGLFPEQVDGMLRRYGENSFAKRKKDTMLRCLRRAFINPFHIILFVLGMISLATDVVLASNFARNATTAKATLEKKPHIFIVLVSSLKKAFLSPVEYTFNILGWNG